MNMENWDKIRLKLMTNIAIIDAARDKIKQNPNPEEPIGQIVGQAILAINDVVLELDRLIVYD